MATYRITGCRQGHGMDADKFYNVDDHYKATSPEEAKEKARSVGVHVERVELLKTIELDCPPGFPRPNHLIKSVIKDTGLELKEPVATMMGNFTWDYSEVSNEQWMEAQPILKERITKLYNKGTIRYGSW